MIIYENYLEGKDIDQWVILMCTDPYDPKVRYKREQIAKTINLTEQQKIIVDLYILEEQTGKRHWEIDPDDPNVYMEWMTGTNILRNKINAFKAMSARQQKAMYNSGFTEQQASNNNNGNSPQFTTQQQPGQHQGTPAINPNKVLRTSSGREIKAADRPDLAKLAAKPKRYPRKSR